MVGVTTGLIKKKEKSLLPSGRGLAETPTVASLLGVLRVTRPLGSTWSVSEERPCGASSFTLENKTKTHVQTNTQANIHTTGGGGGAHV